MQTSGVGTGMPSTAGEPSISWSNSTSWKRRGPFCWLVAVERLRAVLSQVAFQVSSAMVAIADTVEVVDFRVNVAREVSQRRWRSAVTAVAICL